MTAIYLWVGHGIGCVIEFAMLPVLMLFGLMQTVAERRVFFKVQTSDAAHIGGTRCLLQMIVEIL